MSDHLFCLGFAPHGLGEQAGFLLPAVWLEHGHVGGNHRGNPRQQRHLLLVDAGRRQDQVWPGGNHCFDVGFRRCADNRDVAGFGFDVIGHVAAATGNHSPHGIGINRQRSVQCAFVQGDYTPWLAVDLHRTVCGFNRAGFGHGLAEATRSYGDNGQGLNQCAAKAV